MTESADRNRLIEENLGLVRKCAGRFRGRGIDYEDMYSAGCIGLIKAANGFDPSLGYAFSTYAVPAILGEIKRLFRDGGAVKIGRTAKEKAVALMRLRDALAEKLDREPTVTELSEAAGLEPAETAVLLCAMIPPLSLTADREDGECELDIPVDSEEMPVLDRLSLKKALSELEPQDREIIELRYYKGKTQSATGAALGMTQVQVSRREKTILMTLRKALG
ncbi:MAG: sigma-70 family RNA polymerase sigma factor [Clostridia bacterium]|nr:sigma-70 family RNA polymerase sigma factor [Clostridia bacterium]